MVSKPNKIILESIAKAKGQTVEEVKDDLQKSKSKPRKRKKKKIGATLELISDGKAKTIDYNQVRGNKSQNQAKENVSEWKIKDVAFYIRSKYEERYNKDWKHKTVGACTELMRIHDRILDIYGLCDFFVMKDYVDFIFDRYIDIMIDRADGIFYLRNFRDDKYVMAFSQEYDYKISTIDPDGNDVYFYIQWGDGDNVEWTGPYSSGEEITLSHSWDSIGTYTIKVKAKDNYGAESSWSELTVKMPKARYIFINMFEKFPKFYQIIQHFNKFILEIKNIVEV